MEVDPAQPVNKATRDQVTQIGMTALDPDVIRFILDASPELTLLENELLGKKFNTVSGAFETTKYSEARINEAGITYLMSDLRIRISKLTTQSKLKEATILMLIKRYAYNCSLWLFKYHEEWDIKSNTDRTMILRLLVDTYFLTLHRAEGGWSGNSLSKMYQKTDTFQERERPKKGLRRFLPF